MQQSCNKHNSLTKTCRYAILKNTKVILVPLTADDREQFILDNQWAFKYGAIEEHGKRDDHLDFDGEIISRKTIEGCVDAPDSETYRIVVDGRNVGGVILKINKETNHNELEILFVSPEEHTKGIGFGAWQAVEALHPETEVWETCTPYFERRSMSINAVSKLTSFGVSISFRIVKCRMETNTIPTRVPMRCSTLLRS